MSRAKIIVIVIACIAVISMGVIAGLFIANNRENNKPKVTYSQSKKSSEKNDLTSTQKKIAGIEEKETIEDKIEEKKAENYSELYKEYLNYSEEQKKKTEVVPREENVKIDKLQEIKRYLAEGIVPERFNLAENIEIKTDDQGRYGLCWAFASMNSLETHLALAENKNYDLSEMHLNYVESNLLYGYRDVHTGGNFGIFKNYLNISGPVLEQEVPYKEYSEKDYIEFPEMKPSTIVTETIDFPTIYKDQYCTYTEEEIKDFRETVKKHIMQNGGLYCVIATPDDGTKYFNSITKGECFLGDYNDLPQGRTVHAVTLVGWDDNYSKDNFKDGMKPQNDGAYIAFNSWGSWWGDNGYFYISYEDKYVESNLCGVVSTSLKDAYKLSDIPNKAIKDYLEDTFGNTLIVSDGEKYVTKNLLSTISSVDLSGRGMTSLSGIEIFTNAYALDLSNNKISNLANLVNLEAGYIDLSNNNISDVSPIANCKNHIWSLNLANNNIKDVSSLENINSKDEYTYEINLSGNKNVEGYEKLKYAHTILLNDCGLKSLNDLSAREYLCNIYADDNPDITINKPLPSVLRGISLENCNLDESKLKDVNFGYLSSLDVSGNNIKSFDWLKNLPSLGTLDISENKIEDFSGLTEYLKNKTKLDIEDEYYDYPDDDEYFSGYMEVYAQNCGIEDISIFNEAKVYSFDFSNNNIKDISNFSNTFVHYIDLSGNKDIKGISSLNGIEYIILNDCNISNLDEVKKLSKTGNLSLENNHITDISELSNLNNLYSLSLAGNKNITGSLKLKELEVLNLENCNINNDFDLSGLKKMYSLNIDNNPKVVSVEKLIKPLMNSGDWLYIKIEQIDYDDFMAIKNGSNHSIGFDWETELIIKSKLTNGNQIDYTGNYNISKFLKTNWMKTEIENGKLDVKKGLIIVDNTDEYEVKVKATGYSSDLSGLDRFVFRFKTKPVETEANVAENTVANTVDNTVNNTINNTVKNEVTNNVSVENKTENTVTITTNDNEQTKTENVIESSDGETSETLNEVSKEVVNTTN